MNSVPPRLASLSRPHSFPDSMSSAAVAQAASGSFVGQLIRIEQELEQVQSLPGKEEYLLRKIAELYQTLDDVRDQRVTESEKGSKGAEVTGRRVILVTRRLPFNIHKSGSSWVCDPIQNFAINEELQSYQELQSGLEGRQCIWVGSPGVEVEPREQYAVRNQLMQEPKYVPVFLDNRRERLWYKGYCKKVLWPLFHSVAPTTENQITRHDTEYRAEEENEDKLWNAYVAVNRAFADVIQDIYQEGDLVCIQDYHLLLLPQMLRALLPPSNLSIGFFLHLPFPTSEFYRILPSREALLEGVLAADLIGFQNYDYARHFQSSATRILGVNSSHKGIEFHGHFATTTTCPVGVNAEYFGARALSEQVSAIRTELLRKFGKKKVLLGVDRLDGSKGLLHKFLAVEELFNTHPDLADEVVVVQVILQSEEHQLESLTQSIVSRINSRFQDIGGGGPVQLIYRDVDEAELIALYSVTSLLITTPIRDGMNTVPFQYVASRHALRELAAVVLSEYAGSCQCLGGATLVNPWDAEATAESLFEALTRESYERRQDHENMYQYVHNFTARSWANNFIEQLQEAAEEHLPCTSRLLSKKEVLAEYSRSNHRLIVINYDGILADESSIPELSMPSERIYQFLHCLLRDEKNTLLIISGRSGAVMEKWFGNMPVILVAEYGAFIRWGVNQPWQSQLPTQDTSWWENVEPLLEYYGERTPGVFIERKEASITWHFRDCDQDHGLWQARELQFCLNELTKRLPIVVVPGPKSLDIRPLGVSKASVMESVLKRFRLKGEEFLRKSKEERGLGVSSEVNAPTDEEKRRDYDFLTSFVFVAATGDDRTDEDMFDVLAPAPIPIKEPYNMMASNDLASKEAGEEEGEEKDRNIGLDLDGSSAEHSESTENASSSREQRWSGQTVAGAAAGNSSSVTWTSGPNGQLTFAPRRDLPPVASVFNALKRKYGADFHYNRDQLPNTAAECWSLVRDPQNGELSDGSKERALGVANSNEGAGKGLARDRTPAKDDASNTFTAHSLPLNTFVCTVGRKLSQAPYYVRRSTDVLEVLHDMAECSISSLSPKTQQVARALSRGEISDMYGIAPSD